MTLLVHLVLKTNLRMMISIVETAIELAKQHRLEIIFDQ